MSQEDIDSASAPLIEHLIELGRRLMYSIIAVHAVAGAVVTVRALLRVRNLRDPGDDDGRCPD